MLVECPKCHQTREVKKQPRKGVVCRHCKVFPKKEHTLFRVCKVCGDKKAVKSIAESKKNVCRDCYLEQSRKDRTRTCKICGDVKIVATRRDAEATMCKKCAGIENAKKRVGTVNNVKRVKYYYFCVDCNHIKIRNSKQRTIRCADCSRKAGRVKTKSKQPYFDFNTMTIISPIKIVTKKKKVVKPKKKVRTKTKKAKPKPKPKEKTVSQRLIEQERERNRLHRQQVKEAKAKNTITNNKSDDDMIAEFLSKNKPSVIDNSEMKHVTPSCGLCANELGYY